MPNKQLREALGKIIFGSGGFKIYMYFNVFIVHVASHYMYFSYCIIRFWCVYQDSKAHSSQRSSRAVVGKCTSLVIFKQSMYYISIYERAFCSMNNEYTWETNNGNSNHLFKHTSLTMHNQFVCISLLCNWPVHVLHTSYAHCLQSYSDAEIAWRMINDWFAGRFGGMPTNRWSSTPAVD